MSDNTLYYGDNLDILRRYLKDETVDLVYLDPPFNSNASYNVLFAEKDGSQAASQIKAFDDTWQWSIDAERVFLATVEAGGRVSQALQAFRTLLGTNDMLAYLTMMAPRLVELRRVLKLTGSLYLHCDPTASHYLKVLLDAVFGVRGFVNHINWKRTSAHSDTKQGSRHYGRQTDHIIYYRRTDAGEWNQQWAPYDRSYVDGFYRHVEPDTGRRYRLSDMTGPGGAAKGNPQYDVMGVTRYWRYSRERMQQLIGQGRVHQSAPERVPQEKRYLDEMPGVPLQDTWTDIPPIGAQAAERLGYPTQKPQALLERIISASSNEGDLVLDPFCGCGTTVAAAQKLGRRWIGIDITHLAITLMKKRLADSFQGQADYRVIGEPTTAEDAEALAAQDPYQFQWWALGLVGARPVEQKKGADKGIDGRIYFHDEPQGGETKQVILSVKAGHITRHHVMELRGVVEKEHASLGVLIALHEPTRPMREEAATAGFYTLPWNPDSKHPKVQLLTVGELLAGKTIDCPPLHQAPATFKQAPKTRGKQAQTLSMPLHPTTDDDEGEETAGGG